MALSLCGWSFLSPRLPTAYRVPVQAGMGGLLVLVSRAPLGLRPPQVWAGLRWGTAVATLAAAAVAAVTPIPIVRLSMAARELPLSVPVWLGLQIPIGTVLAEEAVFRAALGSVATEAFGPAGGRLLQAGAFGLSHIADARAAREPVLPVVLVTGLAGWLFGWIAERCSSLLAPILVHLAINESGALAAVVVQGHAWNRAQSPRQCTRSCWQAG